MDRLGRQTGTRLLAFVILLSLAADLLLKKPLDFEQALWSCYWASFAVAIGIFARRTLLVSAGLVFFAGLGTPAWVLGRLLQFQVDPTSVLIHTLPLLAGIFYLREMAFLPRYSARMAWGFHIVPLAFARTFCTGTDNVNLARSVWPPLESFVPSLWQFHLILISASAVTLGFAAISIDRWLERHSRSKPICPRLLRAA